MQTQKNMLMLLGISLCVAVVSTAVFYALVAAKIRERSHAADGAAVATAAAEQGGTPEIPRGFRAVSVEVADSTGVVRMLEAGHRVDVQVVYQAESPGRAGASVRTALQNLAVLRVEPLPEGGGDRGSPAVVTLLAQPEEADVLAVAHSAGKVRLLLRHPSDRDVTTRRPLEFSSVVGEARPPATKERRTGAFSATGRPVGAEREAAFTAARR